MSHSRLFIGGVRLSFREALAELTKKEVLRVVKALKSGGVGGGDVYRKRLEWERLERIAKYHAASALQVRHWTADALESELKVPLARLRAVVEVVKGSPARQVKIRRAKQRDQARALLCRFQQVHPVGSVVQPQHGPQVTILRWREGDDKRHRRDQGVIVAKTSDLIVTKTSDNTKLSSEVCTRRGNWEMPGKPSAAQHCSRRHVPILACNITQDRHGRCFMRPERKQYAAGDLHQVSWSVAAMQTAISEAVRLRANLKNPSNLKGFVGSTKVFPEDVAHHILSFLSFL